MPPPMKCAWCLRREAVWFGVLLEGWARPWVVRLCRRCSSGRGGEAEPEVGRAEYLVLLQDHAARRRWCAAASVHAS